MRKDDSTYRSARIDGSYVCVVRGYSDVNHYIPSIKENFNFAIPLAYFTKDTITISTEEKRKTKKGGN